MKGMVSVGFRFDMQNKSPQQQAIVRQRDEAERKRKVEAEKKKRETAEKELEWEEAPRKAAYDSIVVKNKEKHLLELRVSQTALVNEPCGLKGENVHEWLFSIAKTFIYDVKEYKILMITSQDINNKKLNKSWKNLKIELE